VPLRRQSRPETLLIIAGATLALALLAVGVASREVVRHVIQAAPLMAFCVMGAREPSLLRWLLAPVFLFWLLICVLIWLFLLHIARIASGTFSPAEIALTLVMGAASIVGLSLFRRARRPLTLLRGLGVAFLALALQVGAFAVSTRPWVARADGHAHSDAHPVRGAAQELA
jgi:hypothetical protein